MTLTAAALAVALAAAYNPPKLEPLVRGSVIATGTTTRRNLSDRFAELVALKDFGAKCDGATNDTAAFAAALAALPAEGGTVSLPAGRCMLNATTIAKRNITLRGVGSGSIGGPLPFNQGGTVLDFSGVAKQNGLVFSVASSRVALEHLAITGTNPDAGWDGASVGVSFTASPEHVTMLDVSVTHFSTGIYLGGNNALLLNVRTRHTEVAGLRIGAHVTTVVGGYFSDCIRDGGTGGNVLVSAVHDVTILNAFVDEAFGTSPASIRVVGSTRVRIVGGYVFTSPQGGTGVVVDATSHKVTLDGVDVGPFDVGEPAGAYAVSLAGEGHTLRDVTTRSFAGGLGGGILDNATDTYRVRVSVAGGAATTRLPVGTVTLTYGATVAVDATVGEVYAVTATNGTAFTVAAPTGGSVGQRLTIRVRNGSGGVLGAVTWNAAYKLAAWTSPANGQSRAVTFVYDGTSWVEASRTPADVPN